MGDWLNSIFDYVGTTSAAWWDAALLWLYGLILACFQVLYELDVLIAQWFAAIAQNDAAMLGFTWHEFFHNIFGSVWDAIKGAWQWLEKHLKSLVDFLKKLRAMYERWWNLYMRPILVMIQHVRQYLQILSLLHIKLAQQLDAYLAQIQAKIVQSYTTVVATLNTLIDISNALMDPRYLIRHPVLLLSIRRQIPALIHAISGRPPGYWFPSPKGTAGSPFAPPTWPFNFADPSQNPATSTYLGDDGISSIGGDFLSGFQFADGSVDAVQPLDYFNDDLYQDNTCPQNPVNCYLRSLGVTSA